mmetsp:Transcript_44713/g.48381  ORF Transcript_44713/g.48381 Transcript_44713/m.48381 type:complete len:104 (-) Transcript_44713:1115-1426(-)
MNDTMFRSLLVPFVHSLRLSCYEAKKKKKKERSQHQHQHSIVLSSSLFLLFLPDGGKPKTCHLASFRVACLRYIDRIDERKKGVTCLSLSLSPYRRWVQESEV